MPKNICRATSKEIRSTTDSRSAPKSAEVPLLFGGAESRPVLAFEEHAQDGRDHVGSRTTPPTGCALKRATQADSEFLSGLVARSRVLCALVFVVMSSITFAASREKEAPSWVTEVATRTLPAYSGKVPAAVLLDEQKVTVDTSGVMDTVSRHAVKILTHEGKSEAQVNEGYEKGGRQVKELHAWLVAPGGFVKTFEKSDIQDVGAFSDELYNDFRARRIKAENAEIGAVFVYESEVVEKATKAQDVFPFQVDLPEIESRYSITVPAGWTASGIVLNHEPITPVVDGNTYSWSLKNLPFREREEAAPQLFGTAPLLAVDFQPPAGVTTPPALKNWSDVARWHAGIAASQADSSPEMTAKVRELTAGAANEYGKIRAIGSYVQKVRYVEIAMDLSHNGGYRPHMASQVFDTQYGDCKDKANLMRAMLKAAGIESYLVAIYSGDRTFVKKDWASPDQFNHMILAVSVADSTNAPTVVSTPLGRLLFFDPTDYHTPMGDLPYYEQGSYALICASAKGDLLQMPVIQPEANLMAETVRASIDPSGKLTASVSMDSQGQSARNERAKHDLPPDKYKIEMERYLAYYVHGASIAKIDAHDTFDENQFSSHFDFESAGYGQLMQGRMLVFNPSITQLTAHHFPPQKERLGPVILNGHVYRKRVFIKIPEGFTVDEMPSPYQDEAPFAKFNVAFRQEPGQIVVDEELRTEAVTLPATDYPRVKKFFDAVFGANGQNVVLVKN